MIRVPVSLWLSTTSRLKTNHFHLKNLTVSNIYIFIKIQYCISSLKATVYWQIYHKDQYDVDFYTQPQRPTNQTHRILPIPGYDRNIRLTMTGELVIYFKDISPSLPARGYSCDNRQIYEFWQHLHNSYTPSCLSIKSNANLKQTKHQYKNPSEFLLCRIKTSFVTWVLH